MNAVEIEQAISELAMQPFDAAEFPFRFLAAFGNKDVTLKRLRTGNSNASDMPGGVLQPNNIHLAVCRAGKVGETLAALRASPATAKRKARFILATDGQTLEAEDVTATGSGETIACAYGDFPNHFGFFLPLAGISTVKEIKDNPVDIRATGRLNKLYVELLRENPDWATDARRAAMNHFMARLIFCFFAEDTGIFHSESLFTRTIEQMTERDGGNLHQVLSDIIRAMDIKREERDAAQPRLPAYALPFPYVNGALFSGDTATPRFTRMARTYLLHAGGLNWRQINPDIFGSMIQAVADDEERGALGMHYTSVPNILKVLNPLFLDELWAQLDAAGQDKRKLLALRRRMARIRVFDPACGSGNFLVIAYKRMRAIEAEINARRGEGDRKSDIPLTNFRGIELRDFPAEIARLALIIAEFQCDELYRGQREALAEFLPLAKENWIICGNALRLDWLGVCPPTGTGVKLVGDDLFNTPLDQTEIDFENEGGETYICGNPPYRGSKWQTDEQKADLANAWAKHPKLAKTTDFVTGWFARFFDYADQVPNAVSAFVATNSVCQGQQAIDVWPTAFSRDCEIRFAHTSFKWANLASNNAGVTVVVVGLGRKSNEPKRLYQEGMVKQCSAIGPYLVPDSLAYVQKVSEPIGEKSIMVFGNTPIDGGHLLLSREERDSLQLTPEQQARFVRRIYGSAEFIRGLERYCLWIDDEHLTEAQTIPAVAQRIREVRILRLDGGTTAREIAEKSHQFQRMFCGKQSTLVLPAISSENRDYLPVGWLPEGNVVSNKCYAIFDAPLWNLALIASRLHWVWIGTVCVRMRTDFSYSNTLGWNTFPVPLLTEQNKADLTACAEAILLAREAHFPATIAELYNPDAMPDNLRHAHARNDEVLERIYIGRKFKNDTERLEKLFDLYTRMTAEAAKKAPAKKIARRKA